MFCSKCGAEAFGEYCAKCGTRILTESPSSNTQPAAAKKASSAILIKAKNCSVAVEEAEKRTRSFLNSGIGLAAAVMVIPSILLYVVFGRVIATASALSMPAGVWLLLLAMAAITIFFTVKKYREEMEIIERYRNYCSKETLIIDEERIYGTAMVGDVNLSFKKIRSVVCSHCSVDTRNIPEGSLSDKLVITTHDSRQYVFYSFSNCKDLKSVIDMRIK